jgi:hypothetical protein
MKKILLPLLSLLLFSTCKKGHEFDCFKNSGEIVTETRDLDNFTELKVSQKFEVELKQDITQTPKIEITFNKNLMHGISHEVKNNVLELKDNNKCNWVRSFDNKPIVKIYYQDISNISIEGSAIVFNKDTMQVNSLKINHGGLEDASLRVNNLYFLECNSFNAGGFILKGFAGVLAATMDDIAVLDARDLITDDLYFFQYSIKDAHVKSRQRMEIKLFGKGNVHIHEKPSNNSFVNLQQNGKGEFKFY